MRLTKYIFLLFLLMSSLYSKEAININFKDLKIDDLIKITSKIINKNILITDKINGTVDFISNTQVYKEDILNILIYVLEDKGYTIADNNGILRVLRINDVSKYNLPVIDTHTSDEYYQMITEIFVVPNANVDLVSSKIRHLISKSAKLVTDKDTNAIILTDFLENIKTIKKVIDLISKDSEKAIEIIVLENIQSSTAVTTLTTIAKSIYNEQVENEKVTIIPNKDDNSLIIIGKEKNVKYLTTYIKNIDKKGSLVEQVVDVISLKNVESKNVLTILNSIIGKKVYIDPTDKPFASIDEESNSIVLMGPREEVNDLKELMEKLDVDKPQVYVKARIIEVSERQIKKVGLKYGLAGFDQDLGIFSANLGGELLGASTIKSYLGDTASVSNILGISIALNLLKNNQAINIVSEPSLLCINNKESSIYVGETNSFQTGTTTATTGTTSSFAREDIGLTLKVKPRISSGNKVTLEIETKLEGVKETATAGQTNPDTTKKEIKTITIVNNGESAILGGLIQTSKDTIKDKIPFFGDIPLIGALFRNEQDVNDKKNLVIIITPYIIPTSSDLNEIRTHLAELKILEDKYTKDLIVRLEEKALQIQNEDLERDKELDLIKEGKKELTENRVEYEKDKAEEEKKSNDKKTQEEEIEMSYQERHKQILREQFGVGF